MSDDLLKNLNPEQREAVTKTDTNMLIVAGAGSGKTRVLTHKIAYLLKDHQVKPSSILAMTFSNRAAREMKERIASLLSYDLVPRWVGTFHSICVRIIREFISDTKLKDNFTIYDEGDQASLVKESLSLLNFDDKKYKPRKLVELFSKYKNENLREERYFERETDRVNIEKIYDTYSSLLLKNNAIDFGGILIEALKLLKKPEIQMVLKQRWRHVLIDEYQDTNTIQRELLKNIKSPDNYICAVGDDDQSIYMWRGATIENILLFPEDFPNSLVIKLEKNYRSTKKILKTANALIQYNSRRMGKVLFTDNGDGDDIEFYPASDERDEATFISGKIDCLNKKGTASISDIAIFYRTHAQSRAIEEALVSRNIPYKIIGGWRFYDRKEIKDILAYLKFLANKADGVSFKRIVNVPARGIGKRALEILESFANSKNTTPYDVLKKKLPFDEKGISKFKPFRDLIEQLELHKDESISSLTSKVIELSGYQQMLKSDDNYEAETKIDNLKELISSMKEFERIHQDASLTSYLESISLIADTDAYNETSKFVTLMTIHCSKGLEFKTVFIAGLEDGLFPHQNSLNSESEIEEERRLLYVAITRAMEKLYLTNAFQRRFYSTPTYKMPSRFLEEIKGTFISNVKLTDITYPRTSKRRYQKESSDFSDYVPDYDGESTTYRKGTKVRHPDFGDGVIQKCERSGEHHRLTINFRYFGVKKIVPEYAKLEILN